MKLVNFKVFICDRDESLIGMFHDVFKGYFEAKLIFDLKAEQGAMNFRLILGLRLEDSIKFVAHNFLLLSPSGCTIFSILRILWKVIDGYVLPPYTSVPKGRLN